MAEEEYTRYSKFMGLNDYNKWAESFEEEINRIECYGSDFISFLVRIFVSDKNSKILDVGAGTGLSADKLKRFGYTNLDSLEPAENMVEIAKKKGCYVNYFVEGLTDNERSSIQDNAYDALISQGAFGLEGHIPSSGLRECIRLIKPNGLVFIIFRYEYLFLNKDYAQNFDRIIEEMKQDETVEVLVRTRFPEYLKTKEGIIIILKKLK